MRGVVAREAVAPLTRSMTSVKWLEVPVEIVPISQLYATQDGVYFDALLEVADPVGGDRFPHVAMDAHGCYLLEDGHHRVLRAALAGRAAIAARVLRPAG